MPFFISLPYKVIHQFWTVFDTMMYKAPAAQWIIIQVRKPHQTNGVVADYNIRFRTRLLSLRFMWLSLWPTSAGASF